MQGYMKGETKMKPTGPEKATMDLTTKMIAIVAAICLILSLILAVTTAQTSDQVTDTFERQTLGPNWQIWSGTANIVNGSDLGIQEVPIRVVNGLSWVGSTFQADQFSEVQLSNELDPLMFIQVFVRRSPATGQRYGFHWQSGGDCDGGWVLKLDGGSGAPILSCALDPTPPQPGDTLRIEAAGSIIQGFHNNIPVVSAIDTTLLSGTPGIIINPNRSPVTTYPTSVISQWTGGSLSSSPPTPTPTATRTPDPNKTLFAYIYTDGTWDEVTP